MARAEVVVLEFDVGPVPVTIHASSLVFLAFLGWGIGDGVAGMLVWLAAALVALMVHEGGHAAAFLTYGYRPEIEIAGLGGVTRVRSPGRLSPMQSFVTSIAGPLAGFAAAAVVFGGLFVLEGVLGIEQVGLGGWALGLFVMINVVWGVLNLLPILPLDGGQAMLAVLRRTMPRRALRVARAVSAVVAGLLLAGALALGDMWLVILSGLFLVSNLAPADDRA